MLPSQINWRHPRPMIYADRDGVENLYNQIVDRAEVESTRSTELERGNKILSKIGVSAGLLNIIGLGEIGAQAEHNRGNKDVELTKYVLTPEQKLMILISYLEQSEEPVLFWKLSEALRYCRKTNQSLYIFSEIMFDLPQFFPGAGGIEAVKRDEILMFEVKRQLRRMISSEEHTRSGETRESNYLKVAMHASYEKCYLSKSFALPYVWEVGKGKNVSLMVFGYVMPVNDLYFQIKPYSIWLR